MVIAMFVFLKISMCVAILFVFADDERDVKELSCCIVIYSIGCFDCMEWDFVDVSVCVCIRKEQLFENW